MLGCNIENVFITSTQPTLTKPDLPFLNISMYYFQDQPAFSFELIICDACQNKRRIRYSTYNSKCFFRPFANSCSIQLQLNPGWNLVQLPLDNICRKIFNQGYKCLKQLKVNANCKLKRIYVSSKFVDEKELPYEYRTYKVCKNERFQFTHKKKESNERKDFAWNLMRQHSCENSVEKNVMTDLSTTLDVTSLSEKCLKQLEVNANCSFQSIHMKKESNERKDFAWNLIRQHSFEKSVEENVMTDLSTALDLTSLGEMYFDKANLVNDVAWNLIRQHSFEKSVEENVMTDLSTALDLTSLGEMYFDKANLVNDVNDAMSNDEVNIKDHTFETTSAATSNTTNEVDFINIENKNLLSKNESENENVLSNNESENENVLTKNESEDDPTEIIKQELSTDVENENVLFRNELDDPIEIMNKELHTDIEIGNTEFKNESDDPTNIVTKEFLNEILWGTK
ncbi:uncharacterized protein LOC103512054 [Diaphorina citri]|uniref:Uncharacterized protein LOC103512054 n=1 Tax=Diaphorina citri TaxID=121845 RepID=A0A1S3D5V3_DIACI|nr:uncharacterized protein LOC103512054 [Diaphorina citri]